VSLRWRIYYRSGITVNSSQSTWEQAPSSDIVAVVWKHDGESKPHVEIGTPYYIHAGDWIARVWDCTLYLRKYGVKFGRWARFDLFQDAWRRALTEMYGKDVAHDHTSTLSSMCGNLRPATAHDPKFSWHAWYDDGKVYSGLTLDAWQLLPTDGILSACYSHVLNDMIVSVALRRYTFYLFRNGELVNTDHLDDLLKDFPMFKTGCPAFTGQSYLAQAQAIADAMADTLEDVH
jgi:hypothetical protein